MASEITYAEVKFKNESPTPVVKGLPEKKKPEQHPQKYPLWLPWLISLLLLLVCIALVVVLLVVVPFSHSSDQPSALQQQFSKWECDSAVPQGTERGWTCCPKGWRRFQRSCYFLSLDRMNCAESAQNCTGMGSHLVVITSKAEQEFLYKQKTPSTKRDNIYIGLLKDTVGQWQWADKTPYNGTPTFWRQGEPSDNLDGNCTVMDVVGVTLYIWNNVNPDRMHHRICEAAAVIV
uniref:C-type lectin domain family 4 member A n=1 Tax=Taeniopygia guttata TaxID=59729 RepID=H0ZSD9_TAEGU